MGDTSADFHPKSPLRYKAMDYIANAVTTTTTAIHLGVVEAAGKVKDLFCAQQITGDGTSWTVAIKKNGTTIMTTDAVVAAAGGTNKYVNTILSPLGTGTLPTGCTKPVLDPDQVSLALGDVLTADITVAGTYNTGFTGSIKVLWEPTY